jgi:ribonucleotide monophosphatase NagD (HAD superfamily)
LPGLTRRSNRSGHPFPCQLLKREIKALAFDQYGTIVDMQKGLTEAVTPFLKRKAWAGSPSSFVTCGAAPTSRTR